MQEEYILAFDVGTQSVRGLLIDRYGNAAASVKETYEEPYYSLEPNWAEQRPEFYYETICSAARKLKAKAPEAFSQAVCVAPTVFRNSAVCLDKERKPLRDCILWLDRRRVQNPPKLAWWRRVMFCKTEFFTAFFFHSLCLCFRCQKFFSFAFFFVSHYTFLL